MSGTQTVVYVAATTEAAQTGASALASEATGVDVEPATTPEAVRTIGDAADCVVFAETPTTSEGATVLEVIEAAAGTPLVLFTERSFEPAMARSTDGVAGYVRRDTPDAVAHLADEIAWHCPGEDATTGSASAGADADRHRRAAERLAVEYAALTRTLSDRTAERDRLDGACEQLQAQRDRAGVERDRFSAAFSAYPAPACAYTVGPEATPTVTAVTDTFETAFGIDPENAVGASIVDVFDSVGVSLDGDRFRNALEPERADRNWITGTRAGERGGTVVDPEAAVGRETAAIGAHDGRAPTDAIAMGTNRETTLDGRLETADGVREFAITVVPPAGATADSSARTGLVVCTDVTDRRHAERQLAARTHRLESIAELLDDDFRESLNVARGYLEVAEETGDREHFAEIDDAHDSLREATDHLARLVGRDAVVVEHDAIDLHDLVRRAWVAVDTGDASLDLGPNARFEGDRGQLREVFEHLIAVATGADSTADGSGGAGESEPGAFEDDAVEIDGDGGGAAGRAADGAAAGETVDPVVSVGATDDGFYVAGSTASGDSDPFEGRTAAADGTGLRLGRVERAAEAHGWGVGVAESDEGTAFAFRGVDVEDAE